MRKAPILVLVLALAAAEAGYSFGFTSVDPRLGVIYEMAPSLKDGNGYSVGGPPLQTYYLGVGTTFELGGLFTWEPSLDFYYGYYLWSEQYGRAVSTDIPWRTSFTMAFLVESPFVISLPLFQVWDLALGVGPAFNLRASIYAAGVSASNAQDAADLAKINAYFYDKGRWFLPETFLRVSYHLSERLDFAFAAQGFWPLFDLWNGASSVLDEGIFGGTLVVKAKLR